MQQLSCVTPKITGLAPRVMKPPRPGCFENELTALMKLGSTTARQAYLPGEPPKNWLNRLSLVDKQGDHGIALDDAFERLGQQRCAGQLTDLAASLGRVGQRYRVGHDQLVQRRIGDALDCRAGQHWVGAIRDHFLRAALFQHFGSLDQGTCGVDHVIHDHAVTAFDFTDDVHHFRHVGLRTTLVDDGQVAAQAFGQGARTYHTADVRRYHQQILVVLLLQVAQQNWRSVNIVNRDIEEALDLVCVQIHDQDALDARFFQHVRDHLGRDRNARRTWATVLTGIAEVRNSCGDTASGRALQGVDHQDQLHQAVVGRGTSRLQNKDVFTADVFVNLNHHFAVRDFWRLLLPMQD